MSNYLDTRDLYKRQCELQEALDTLETELEDALDDDKEMMNEQFHDNCFDQLTLDNSKSRVSDAQKALSDWKEENQDELTELDDLETEVGREWMHGATLIPEDEFTAYAQDCAEDQGMDRNQPWPYSCIDWDQAADELKQDFSCCTYQGTDYFFRS